MDLTREQALEELRKAQKRFTAKSARCKARGDAVFAETNERLSAAIEMAIDCIVHSGGELSDLEHKK